MTIDILTLGAGVFSFGVFLLIHLITFRWVAPEHLLKSLLLCVIAVMMLPVLLMAVFFAAQAENLPFSGWVCSTLVAVLIQGLLCFVYVLCIFGPYETSVRMRLVREIAQAGAKGITRQELAERYNAQTIMEIRLQRLLGSGDINEKDGQYASVNKRNLFFIFDDIAGVLKKWINQ